ncbi:ArsR/SmtB family transcription factor [Sediminibacterium ginsengisoli]|uniref:DNA-binding transcriptional regulator, ArsR family n=1 Tax=Sediminibacterium ginsengisoli TaxID=413434 RepID=A0A1T4N6U5_9BACT|nr:metalloregulator ArsR/SmtB family transcription factor [Sediminibacterium ginsengisoli]SJZ74924.1 DNA-binding transcriptional regulator, ArsR family [Sediminibacterium ginsengisoli]
MQAIRRDVFQAIADPSRRDMIRLLSRKPMHLNEIAAHFDMSRPAVSKHVRILTECGLLQISNQGRERHCSLNTAKLREVDRWLNQYRHFWNRKLDALEKHLDNMPDPFPEP